MVAAKCCTLLKKTLLEYLLTSSFISLTKNLLDLLNIVLELLTRNKFVVQLNISFHPLFNYNCNLHFKPEHYITDKKCALVYRDEIHLCRHITELININL